MATVKKETRTSTSTTTKKEKATTTPTTTTTKTAAPKTPTMNVTTNTTTTVNSGTSTKPTTENQTGTMKMLKGFSTEERDRMVAESAYFRAQKRNFQGDCAQEDWFAAEREIEALMQSNAN